MKPLILHQHVYIILFTCLISLINKCTLLTRLLSGKPISFCRSISCNSIVAADRVGLGFCCGNIFSLLLCICLYIYIYKQDPWDIYLQLENMQYCLAFKSTGSIAATISREATVEGMTMVSYCKNITCKSK